MNWVKQHFDSKLDQKLYQKWNFPEDRYELSGDKKYQLLLLSKTKRMTKDYIFFQFHFFDGKPVNRINYKTLTKKSTCTKEP